MGCWFIMILWHSLRLLMDTNYTDKFINDSIPSLDQSVPQHVSWRDLPDQEEGLGELLNGILECSHSAAQQHAPATNGNGTSTSCTATIVDQVARLPGLHDYPLEGSL